MIWEHLMYMTNSTFLCAKHLPCMLCVFDSTEATNDKFQHCHRAMNNAIDHFAGTDISKWHRISVGELFTKLSEGRRPAGMILFVSQSELRKRPALGELKVAMTADTWFGAAKIDRQKSAMGVCRR